MGVLGSLLAWALYRRRVPFTWSDAETEVSAWRASTGAIYPGGLPGSVDERCHAAWDHLIGDYPEEVRATCQWWFAHKQPPHKGRFDIVSDAGILRQGALPSHHFDCQRLVEDTRAAFAADRQPATPDAPGHVVVTHGHARAAHYYWGWTRLVRLDFSDVPGAEGTPAAYARHQRFNIRYAYPKGPSGWWYAGSTLRRQSEPRFLDEEAVFREYERWREHWEILTDGRVPVTDEGDLIQGHRPAPGRMNDGGATDALWQAQLRCAQEGDRLYLPVMAHNGLRHFPAVLDQVLTWLEERGYGDHAVEGYRREQGDAPDVRSDEALAGPGGEGAPDRGRSSVAGGAELERQRAEPSPRGGDGEEPDGAGAGDDPGAGEDQGPAGAGDARTGAAGEALPVAPAPRKRASRRVVDRTERRESTPEERERAMTRDTDAPQALFIFGSSGSGKSTAARRIIEQYSSRSRVYSKARQSKVSRPICYLLRGGRSAVDGHPLRPAVIPGHYDVDCGGCDTLQVEEVFDITQQSLAAGYDVILEGLILSSLVGRVLKMHEEGVPVMMAAMNTPIQECIENINKRRAGAYEERLQRAREAGRREPKPPPPLSERNVENKCRIVQRAYERMSEAGCATAWGDYDQTVDMITRRLAA